MICALLVLAIGTVGVAPITAGAVYVEPADPSQAEGDVSTQGFAMAKKVAASVVDWLMRIHFLRELWHELQARVTFVHGRTGIAHWALSGEHAADIVNGVVNWK